MSIALVGFGLILIRTAWLGDDAYITQRTINQLAAGNGPVWNSSERVQAYTHPLWLAILTVGFYITRQPFLTTIWISIAASMCAVAVLTCGVARSALSGLLLLGVLALSRSFVDYSTSGLENPVSHLLIAVFVVIFLSGKRSNQALGVMSLAASLAILNRLDTAVVLLPPLAVLVWSSRSGQRWLILAANLLPLIAWELFSVAFYGFPLPNTYYAKLWTGIPAQELLVQGIHYFQNVIRVDPITPVFILLGLAAAVRLGKPRELAVGSGVLLYLAYVLLIGGDFMAGRFLALPLLASLGIIVRALEKFKKGFIPSYLLVLALGLATPYPTIFSGASYGEGRKDVTDEWGISDERAIYYPFTGLLSTSGDYRTLRHAWMLEGVKLREGNDTVVIGRAIGMLGYYAGQQIHIVDQFALADPLLARLPVDRDSNLRVGHYKRRIPEGYVESILAGENLIVSPHLAEYYERLSTIVRGPFWDSERFREIWRFNTGAYRHLLVAYSEGQ